MFSLIGDAVNAVVDVVDDVAEEVVGKRIIGRVDVKKMIEGGMTIYAIADVTGMSVDAVRKMIHD